MIAADSTVPVAAKQRGWLLHCGKPILLHCGGCWQGAVGKGSSFLSPKSVSVLSIACNNCCLHLAAARAVHHFHLLSKGQQLPKSVLDSG